MASISNSNFENLPETVAQQACVKALFSSKLPPRIKTEAFLFIRRNILKDCQRVPPNCLKAHLIRTVKVKKMPSLIPKINALFKSKQGYDGYYLDNGKLFRS